MIWEFHTYTLVTGKGEKVLCFRPYTHLLNEYIDDRGFTDCYVTHDVIRSFIIRVYRQLGDLPPSFNPADYITINESIGEIYVSKIYNYAPFPNKKEAIKFLRKNQNYDFEIQKVGYPPDISISEISKDICFYRDPITRRKYFIDHHFYRDFLGFIRRRRVKLITTDNISKVKVLKPDSHLMNLILCMYEKEMSIKNGETERAVKTLREKLATLIPKFSEISGIDIREVSINFGPYPPTKPVISLKPCLGNRINLEAARNLVNFINFNLRGLEGFQKNFNIPPGLSGFYFEIIDLTHRMPVYTNGFFYVDKEGLSIFS